VDRRRAAHVLCRRGKPHGSVATSTVRASTLEFAISNPCHEPMRPRPHRDTPPGEAGRCLMTRDRACTMNTTDIGGHHPSRTVLVSKAEDPWTQPSAVTSRPQACAYSWPTGNPSAYRVRPTDLPTLVRRPRPRSTGRNADGYRAVRPVAAGRTPLPALDGLPPVVGRGPVNCADMPASVATSNSGRQAFVRGFCHSTLTLPVSRSVPWDSMNRPVRPETFVGRNRASGGLCNVSIHECRFRIGSGRLAG
jgi:hypothetical protein